MDITTAQATEAVQRLLIDGIDDETFNALDIDDQMWCQEIGEFPTAAYVDGFPDLGTITAQIEMNGESWTIEVAVTATKN